jgi:serine/threonine-protein kinase HipA
MARPRKSGLLAVWLNGKRVGTLRRASSGAIDFQYDPDWLAWENAIPVSLSMPLREDRFIGDPVLAVFDNLLPDNEGIRKQVAEKTGAAGDDAYSLLATLGRDCIGALQFLPEGEDPGLAGSITGRAVTDKEIEKILVNLARNPLGLSDDQEFRISIAGAQEKTALLFWKGRWYVPHGSTPTTHILKPQIGKLKDGIDMSRSVENEHLCLRIVAALGLPAATSQIKDFGKERVIVVERFDRLWAKDGRLLRLPQEDLCQALSVPPSRKYESEGGPGIPAISNILKGSDQAEADRLMFFKAQIVFWLLAAIDGHAKNFSIQLSPQQRFRLSPIYDVMSVQLALDKKQIQHNKVKMAMAVGNTRHYVLKTIAPRHFIETAKACGLPEKAIRQMMEELADTALEKIIDTLGAMPKDMPGDLMESIAEGATHRLQRIGLMLKAGAAA